MKGVLVVEDISRVETKQNAALDGFESNFPKTTLVIARSEDRAT